MHHADADSLQLVITQLLEHLFGTPLDVVTNRPDRIRLFAFWQWSLNRLG